MQPAGNLAASRAPGRLYDRLGAHPATGGTRFAVRAPGARAVSVIGDFNDWDPQAHPLKRQRGTGVWQGTVSGATKGQHYKYHVTPRRGEGFDKADPGGFYHATPPATASIIWDLDYAWGDADWMAARRGRNGLDAPVSIYEVHPGSWRRVAAEGNRSLTWRELAAPLAAYATRLGFTHVEFTPVMEHPFFGSWGYQVTGYFAPTSRYGTPQDFMYLVDCLHQAGLGVILDWVPSHFPGDPHGLARFDGTPLYEHPDPRRGFHPDWTSCVFDYGRPEVQDFLIASALFWLDVYHADGLRVDGVASMLYLDYSRKPGEWVPNKYGGRENLEAVAFLQRLNTEVYRDFPDVQTYAEESSAWPMVSRPVSSGGLGFGLKWDLGWMHDTLEYMSLDPVYRRYHQNELTFRMVYAFHENFVLPLSHDEVVHEKSSLLGRMPGDDWHKFANLRLLYGYLFTQPGKKLLFMGGEFAQWHEWQHDGTLEWDLTRYDRHRQITAWVTRLNRLYRELPALHARDCLPEGFQWVDVRDHQRSVVSYLRLGGPADDLVLVVCNFSDYTYRRYGVGVPEGGYWKEVANSDDAAYGGAGRTNPRAVRARRRDAQGRTCAIEITLPSLGVACFCHRRPPRAAVEKREGP